MNDKKHGEAGHVHGPDCAHDHAHDHAEDHGHVHGPHCAHDHHHAMAPARNPLREVGRNDPCPCGSRQKFKKCHGDPRRA